MQLYFKNNFVSLYYHRETRLGKAVWKGRLQGPELREAFLLCIELVDRFSLLRWLADDRLMESIEPADLEWSLQVFVPRLARTPLLRMARLPSQFEKNKESVDTMVDIGKGQVISLVHRDFSDETEAIEWLLEGTTGNRPTSNFLTS